MIERARKSEIALAARERRLPSAARHRGKPLHEARGHRRRAGDLGGAREDHLACAESLGEVVRGKTDAPLRQVEPEVLPHRAAEPRIAARLGRPRAFVEPAEHDAVRGW